MDPLSRSFNVRAWPQAQDRGGGRFSSCAPRRSRRNPRLLRQRNSREILRRRGLVRVGGSPAEHKPPKVPLRFTAYDVTCKAVAVAALIAGVILVKAEPELLLPILPVEALIACELIFRRDREESLQHDQMSNNNDAATDSHSTNKPATR